MKQGAKSLTSFGGLVLFDRYIQDLGINKYLREMFGNLKDEKRSVYQVSDIISLLIDMNTLGISRIFGVEARARDSLIVRLSGGFVPSIDTLYRDIYRFDDRHVAILTELM